MNNSDESFSKEEIEMRKRKQYFYRTLFLTIILPFSLTIFSIPIIRGLGDGGFLITLGMFAGGIFLNLVYGLREKFIYQGKMRGWT